MPITVFPLTGAKRPLWGIRCKPYSPKVVQLCHEMPGMAFDYESDAWVGYPDAVEAQVAMFARHGIICDDRQLRAYVAAPSREHVYVSASRGAHGEIVRDYQRDGIDFILSTAPHGGAILADTMGLGKSLQATLSARAYRGRTLVCCPSSARSVWADPARGELVKWWPAAAGHIFQPSGTKKLSTGFRYPSDKTPAIPPGTMVVVIHYDIVYAWIDVLLRWGPVFVVFDEIHLIQSSKSRRAKSLKEVSRGPATESRLGLSGTPVTNYLQDLWNIVDLISPGPYIKDRDGHMRRAPRMGRTFWRYGVRYCAGHEVEISRDIGTRMNWDGTSNEEELAKRLRHFVLRRTKEDVKLQLPPKTRQVIRVEVPMKFRQAAVAKIDARIIQTLLSKAVDMKIERGEMFELVDEHLKAGNSVVVFTFRQTVAERFVDEMSARGYTSRFIHGGVPQAKRDAILDDLRARASAGPVMLAATIDTTNVAIDLTFAQVGLVAELVFEPHKLIQLEDRLHRYPQPQPVLIQYIIGIGTIEEFVCEVVIDRLGTAKKLNMEAGQLEAALALEEVDIMKELGDKLLAME